VLLALRGRLQEARTLFEQRLVPLGEPLEVDYARVALEDIEQTQARNAAVDRFNVAVRLANQGRTAAAAALFDSLARSHAPADLRQQAAEAAKRLRARR